MIDHANQKNFAYPAINVTSLATANAVLKGLAESKSDGIIQVTTGGAAFASGLYLKDMPLGAISIAEHLHRVAEHYPIYVTLHTDHCRLNIDNDIQYAFTRAIVDHMLKNYDGVLKIESDVGNKGKYDPRSCRKLAEAAMAERAKQTVNDLRGVGTTLFGICC
jgi:fructose/tagatose bisphosphate aldolase